MKKYRMKLSEVQLVQIIGTQIVLTYKLNIKGVKEYQEPNLLSCSDDIALLPKIPDLRCNLRNTLIRSANNLSLHLASLIFKRHLETKHLFVLLAPFASATFSGSQQLGNIRSSAE